ncbi:HVA1 family protein [Acuticoccus sp.]|uniref:HVA1 family protein n=1 Tax=Acuticoccus sp. TaxID=1904378 RepID=UPI003B51B707
MRSARRSSGAGARAPRQGRSKKLYTRKTTRKIKGEQITRNGSKDCPAYYIEQDDGDAVLKLHSEVDKA